MKTSQSNHLQCGRAWLGTLVMAMLIAPLTAPAYAALAEPTDKLEHIEAPADEGPDPFATPEDRERVAPLRWLEDAGGGTAVLPGGKAAEGRTQDATPPDIADSGAPFADANALAKAAFPEAWAELEAVDRMIEDGKINLDALAIPKGTPGVFTRYSGNINTQMWQSAPWNKIGKLYFTTPTGANSYCTANVISQRNILVTAAHCIYTRGRGFNRNFRFVPADRFGAAPYGVYGWQSAAVMTNWVNLGGRRWDVGMIRLGNNTSTGIPVTSYVGWLGRTWNQPYVMNLHSVGYASNLSTQFTHICTAESFNGGLDVLAKGCDMTFGSSGGGWLLRYHPYSSSGAHNLVTGVVSGPAPGGFGTTYVGPRFSSANFAPLCNFYGC